MVTGWPTVSSSPSVDESGEPLALELHRVDAEVDEHGDALGGEDDEGVRVAA